jgi:hypothetical protein
MSKLFVAFALAFVAQLAFAGVILPGKATMSIEARACEQRADQVQAWASMLMLDASVERAMAMAEASTKNATAADRERAKLYVSRASLYADAYRNLPVGREGAKTVAELENRSKYIATREAILCMTER